MPRLRAFERLYGIEGQSGAGMSDDLNDGRLDLIPGIILGGLFGSYFGPVGTLLGGLAGGWALWFIDLRINKKAAKKRNKAKKANNGH